MPKKIRRPHRKSIRINGRREFATFMRKADADSWYFEKHRQKDLSERGISTGLECRKTVRAYAEEWLSSRRVNGKPYASWQMDDIRLRKYIIPAFGNCLMHTVETYQWERFLDELVAQGNFGTATRNRVRSLLSKLYTDGLRKKVANHNPIIAIPRLLEVDDKWDYWPTRDEIEQYLFHSREEGAAFFLFAVTALNTGGREGEILALDDGDIQLDNLSLHFWRTFEESTHTVVKRVKGTKPRWVGINDDMFEAIVEYRRLTPHRKLGSPLICNNSPTIITEKQIRAIHERVCKKAGVKLIRVHDLRHTFASHFVMNGGTLIELQGILGHTSPAMTQKYAHLSPGFLQTKANIVSFSWKPKSAGVISLAAHKAQDAALGWRSESGVDLQKEKGLEATQPQALEIS